MTWPILPIHQYDVLIPITVVIDEGAARTHGLRQILLSERRIVVKELNPRLGGDVTKLNILTPARQNRARQAEDESKSKPLIVHGNVGIWSVRTACRRDRVHRMRRVFCLSGSQGYGDVLMHCLTLVVVFGMLLPVTPRDRLR